MKMRTNSSSHSKKESQSLNKRQKRSQNWKRSSEKNNFQDASEIREYDKGFASGAALQRTLKNKRNDVLWYNKNPKLLADAASFPFSIPAGLRFPIEQMYPVTSFPKEIADNPDFHAYYSVASMTIPGLLTFGVAPTIGISTDQSSPINVASLANYDFVRKANSGARNYDWPDLTLYYMAMDSIYMFWNWLKRIYGLMRSFNAENRYTPRALVEAQGIDYLSFATNLASFRAYLNLKAAQISAFCVPNTFSYMVRHSWLMTHVFMDQATQKAQYYMFVPSWVYKYSERTSDRGGELIPVPLVQQVTYDIYDRPTNLMTFQQISEIFDDMLNAVLTSEDIGTMSGDVSKAYGNSLFVISGIDEEYSVTPTYNAEVLMQIENIQVIPIDTEFSADNFKISQDPDTNLLVWNPELKNPEISGTEMVMLNTHLENPTPQDVMEASRLAVAAQRFGSKYYFSAIGSEWVTGMYMHMLAPNPPDSQKSYIESGDYKWFQVGWFGSEMSQADLTTHLHCVYVNPASFFQVPITMTEAQRSKFMTAWIKDTWLSNFDWHPVVRHFTVGVENGGPFPLNGDVDKYTIIRTYNLQMLHLVALMSMLDVPGR